MFKFLKIAERLFGAHSQIIFNNQSQEMCLVTSYFRTQCFSRFSVSVLLNRLLGFSKRSFQIKFFFIIFDKFTTYQIQVVNV